MNRALPRVLLIVSAIISFVFVVTTTQREASMLLVNGRVYTLDRNNTVCDAIALRGNRIVGVGSREDLARFRTDSVIDLRGKTVYPGLIDGHAHMNGLGALMNSVILYGVPSPEEAVRMVRERVSQVAAGEWITGRGWDQNLWPSREFPTADILDSVSPRNPVELIRVDGHAIWVNHVAMAIAGVSRDTPDPPGGRIVRDSKGIPTGILVEDNARRLISSKMPTPTRSDVEKNILRAAEECAKAGITEVADMGVDSLVISAYRALEAGGRLPLRIYAAISIPGDAWDFWRNREPVRGMFTLRAIKMYSDGALGSRGAALVDSYSDDPGNRGTTISSEEELSRGSLDAMLHGYQPIIHAIGDRGNHITLNAYAKSLSALPPGDYRPRIEHVQVLLPEDIPRFKKLGVLPSMEPVHATSDMYWAEARLGPQRIRGAYAWRSLLETGSIIIGGSDSPNDGLNPLWGFYAAVTRRDRDGYPQDGWYPQEKMSRDEAIRCYTRWAAYGAFEENEKGTIETGKLADLTVLSRDIMQVPASDILTTDVEMTIVDGKIIYRKETPSN